MKLLWYAKMCGVYVVFVALFYTIASARNVAAQPKVKVEVIEDQEHLQGYYPSHAERQAVALERIARALEAKCR
jgi:hypothetical protein